MYWIHAGIKMAHHRLLPQLVLAVPVPVPVLGLAGVLVLMFWLLP